MGFFRVMLAGVLLSPLAHGADSQNWLLRPKADLTPAIIAQASWQNHEKAEKG